MEWKETGGGGNFENPEAGTYGAVCYRVIDLGTQENNYQGIITHKQQVLIAWELDAPMSDGRPFVVSQFYTASLNEKAKLRQHLITWRGRDFTPEELNGFNPFNLLGAPCMLSIVLNDKGKTKIVGVAKLPKGMQGKKAVNTQCFLSLDKDNYDPTQFDMLSDGIKEIVRKSPEYQALSGITSDKPDSNVDDPW